MNTTQQFIIKYKVIDREKSNFNNNEIVIMWHKIDETKALFKSVEREFLQILTFKAIEPLEKI